MNQMGPPGLSRAGRIHFVLAWVLCVAALLLVAATWLPGPSKVPFGAVGVVFVAIFPVVGVALVRVLFSEGGRSLLGRGNGGRMARFAWSLPTGLKWSYAFVLATLLLAMATGGGARDTKTDEHGNHYYTRWNNTALRSERVVLSEAEYHEASKAQARVFASGAALFHALGGFLVLVAASPAAPRLGANGSKRSA
ncbi:hypothetical protein F7R91_41300 [Streptomyces luteolifulvus]|uniref:Uncharacterized protein n=1 Tax=Streptomyces luteolifulvus TaxID=2615112 RepID=A0A6H9UNF1_9ACTN|nr:hypothetical protein [Streptomyces luteolifulvus]KAB1139050.1 hypothetical protein F7R91_41300 [Streptomyces luteolifulvus]